MNWEENIGIAFDNNSNCYADTDSVIPAMTRVAVINTFIPIIESLLKQARIDEIQRVKRSGVSLSFTNKDDRVITSYLLNRIKGLEK